MTPTSDATVDVVEPARVSMFARVTFLGASAASNLLTFGFHLLFSRSLGPRDYSALGALLAVILVTSVPLGALQLAAAKATAQTASTAGLRNIMRMSVLLGLAVFLVFLGVTPLLTHYLDLSSYAPVLWLDVWVGLATVTAGPWGVLVGESRLIRVSVSLLVSGGLLRLAAGLAFNRAGWGVSGAMAATALGQLGALVLMVVALRTRLAAAVAQVRLSVTDGLISAGALTGLALFGSIDDILARHAFTGPDAGLYISAATAGRIVLFAPGAIALMAFPRFASSTDRAAQKRLLGRSLAAVFLLGLACAAVLSAAPTLTVKLLFGSAYGSAGHLLVILSFAGGLLGCLNLTSYYLLAQRHFGSLLGWVGALAVLLVSLAVRLTPTGLAITAGLAAATASGLSVFACARALHGQQSPAQLL